MPAAETMPARAERRGCRIGVVGADDAGLGAGRARAGEGVVGEDAGRRRAGDAVGDAAAREHGGMDEHRGGRDGAARALQVADARVALEVDEAGQRDRGEHGDDRQHDDQLDQGETTLPTLHVRLRAKLPPGALPDGQVVTVAAPARAEPSKNGLITGHIPEPGRAAGVGEWPPLQCAIDRAARNLSDRPVAEFNA